MGTLSESFRDALAYMPAHRARSARSRSLTLDTLLDEGRALSPLPSGTLDLVLMGYRFYPVFQTALAEFTPKRLKPPQMGDLLAIAFAALLTRDQTPEHALVFAAVECARETLGDHVTGLVNAFLRRTVREKARWLERVQAEAALVAGPELAARWRAAPALLERTARQLRERPAKGVASFDAQGQFEWRAVEAFRDAAHPVQAMDAGSWALMQRCLARMPKLPRRLEALDACAAPGGKTIALATGLKRAGLGFHLQATESDFRRLERLRENLKRWQLEEVETSLHAWGPPGWTTEKGPEGPFDFILADLPCSGSGTFHSRPDLLLEKFAERIESLRPIQSGILEALRPLIAPGGVFVVSVCSVDPEEIDAISKMLRAKPDFSSFSESESTMEGLTAWFLGSFG